MDKNNFILVITTVSSETEAKKLGQALIENKLAACVNILPSITSIFRWEGKISAETELIIIAKSHQKLFPMIKEMILSIHSYDVPEIISLPISSGSEEYLKWIEQELQDILT